MYYAPYYYGIPVNYDPYLDRSYNFLPDFFSYQNVVAGLQRDVNLLISQSPVQKTTQQNYGNSTERTTVTNITANRIRFSDAPVTFQGNYLGNFTQGRSYPFYTDAASGGQRGLTVKDNFGVWHTFPYRVPIG
ncbi:hypothetical protein [Paenibacillus gansuensis]|uniref:Uncharacterized protein n=1 Tax=Paenibacillus gansuensis TaxID=306542 RepID=A0ABW5PG24_9BACL